MTKGWAAFLALALLVVWTVQAGARTQSSDPSQLKQGAYPLHVTVMTFNLRRAGLDQGENAWVFRKDAAAHAIADVAPDIVVTQEADLGMLNDMMERVPGYDWLGVNRGANLTPEYSGAILYRTDRLQVVAAGQFWLSLTPEDPGSTYPGIVHPRLANWVRFRIRHSLEEFVVYGTHLDHRSQAAREHGASMIREHVERARDLWGLPVIVAGDMNADPSNEAIRKLRMTTDGQELLRDAADWHRARGGRVGATFHGFRGIVTGLPIDYVLYSKGWDVAGYGIYDDRVDGRFPSDHYPVWATLAFAR